jgi:hypothetical protein
MIILWIVLGLLGVFLLYHFVVGFIEGLGIRRKPRLRVFRPQQRQITWEVELPCPSEPPPPWWLKVIQDGDDGNRVDSKRD